MARRGDQLKTDEHRTEQLKTVAADFIRVHDEWCDDKNRKVPDEVYWDSVEALIDAFDSGDIPGDCRSLAEAVTKFSSAVDAYDDRDNPVENLYPGDDFWAAREGVAAALAAFDAEAKPLTPLETIPSLAVLPGITHLQIAKIYGFKDKHGNWLPHLVQKELDKPGSVLKAQDGVDGRAWRDPRLPLDEGNSAADRRVKAISEKRRSAAKSSTPCPEEPRTLWEQKVSVAQASRMLCKPESEVAQLFADFEAEREAQLLSGEVEDPNTQAIKELKAAGKSIKEIAETLKMTDRQVADALKPKEAAKT